MPDTPLAVNTSYGAVTIPLPLGATVKVTGISNPGGGRQRITVVPSGAKGLIWTGNGVEDNQIIGRITLAPAKTSDATLFIQVSHSWDESSYQLSKVSYSPYAMPGLTGYVICGQDGSSWPVGPRPRNSTVAFVYWAAGY